MEGNLPKKPDYSSWKPDWLSSLIAFTDSVIFVLEQKIITPTFIVENQNSKLFVNLAHYIKRNDPSNNIPISEQSLLLPTDIQQINHLRASMTIKLFLLVEVLFNLSTDKDYILNKLDSFDILSKTFFRLIALSVFDPIEANFDLQNKDVSNNLGSRLISFIKTLEKSLTRNSIKQALFLESFSSTGIKVFSKFEKKSTLSTDFFRWTTSINGIAILQSTSLFGTIFKENRFLISNLLAYLSTWEQVKNPEHENFLSSILSVSLKDPSSRTSILQQYLVSHSFSFFCCCFSLFIFFFRLLLSSFI